MDDTLFCAHCLSFQDYTVKSRLEVHRHPQTKKEILVDCWYPVCDKCGNEGYVGCHENCEYYKAYKQYLEDKKAQERKRRQTEYYRPQYYKQIKKAKSKKW